MPCCTSMLIRKTEPDVRQCDRRRAMSIYAEPFGATNTATPVAVAVAMAMAVMKVPWTQAY